MDRKRTIVYGESYTTLQHDDYNYFGKSKEQQSLRCELLLTTYPRPGDKYPNKDAC
jgi:hypothetical protein